MRKQEAFFQRVAAALIIPVTILPVAAILLAIGSQAGIAPLEAAGMALVRSWLPLIFGIAVSAGFTDGDAMGALAVTVGFLVMTSVAETVAGDPGLNVGVLGGIVAGMVCTWIYNRVKSTALPEYLALFSGKRLGALVAAPAGVALGYLFGYLYPPLFRSIVTFGEWVYAAGPSGVFVYGASLRLLIPTGMHHILMQLVDYQLGGWVDPTGGKPVYGEYLRFLAGDPEAGRFLSGFFVSLGFGPLGAALAITHEARPALRRKVAGLMTTGVLTAFLLGVTEPIEFAFIFASPILYGLHVIFSGFASFLAYALEIHMGGYALPMILINWHRQQNAWLLLPLGLAFTALYYFSFRAVIRWIRPPILGQVEEQGEPEAAPVAADAAGAAYLQALGGAANILSLDACMTRLRLVVRDPQAVSDARLLGLQAVRVLRPGGGELQVVVGAKAGALADQVRAAMAAPPGTARELTLYSPLNGQVISLSDVPDPVFAQKMVGDGLAILPVDGTLVSPVFGQVVHVFPGGHALGIITPEGLELLIHVGIDTVALKGEGFAMTVGEGEQVQPGTLLGRFDLDLIAARGKPLITPVLITNPDQVKAWTPLAAGQVSRGAPLIRVTMAD